jgi:tetratricopeptide (TPR) repeat protein
MAPERFEGRCTPASDVYALGLTLYELLALRPAFEESDRGRLIRLVTQSQPPRLRRIEPSVPRDLETIIHKAIEREPARRYAAAADLAEDLRRYLDGRAIRARRISRPGQAWRWCRRHPSTAALMAAVLALVALAGGGGLWAHRQRAEHRAEVALGAARAREQFDAVLGQAADLRQRGRWAEDRAALDRLERSPEGIGDPRLRQARADLKLAARLAENQTSRAALFRGRRDTSRAAREYAVAFEEAGLTPIGDESLADRIRRSPIRDSLLTALDDWALVAVDDRLRADVLRLARRVDPDPLWSDRLRDPALWGGCRALERMAADVLAATTAEQPPHLLLTLGLLLKEAGGAPEALLRAAQQRHPEDFWINLALAATLAYIKPAESVGFYRAALIKRPDSALAWNELGLALTNTGREDEAMAAFRKAIDLNPGHPAAYSNLGLVLDRRGRRDEAVAALRKAIDLDHDRVPAYHNNNLGVILERQGRLDEAMAAFRKAIDLDPGAIFAYINLARVHIARGQAVQAIEILASASERRLEEAEVRQWLGRAFEAAGRDPVSCAIRRRAIDQLVEASPDDPDAWNLAAVLLA